MNKINMPLTAQNAAPWSTVNAPNPNPMQKAAQDALAIMSQFISESRIALRDEVAAIYFPNMGILYDMHPKTRTKEGDMEYVLSDKAPEEERMHVLLRIVNGRLYNHLGQLECYAHDMKTYTKNMRKAKRIGYNSPEGQNNLVDVLSSMFDESEKARMEALLRMFAIDFDLCYTAPDWRQVVEVTQEMYDAGLTSIINDWECEKSGWTITNLNVGDFLVFTMAGMYTIRRDEFLQTHSTFVV